MDAAKFQGIPKPMHLGESGMLRLGIIFAGILSCSVAYKVWGTLQPNQHISMLFASLALYILSFTLLTTAFAPDNVFTGRLCAFFYWIPAIVAIGCSLLLGASSLRYNSATYGTDALAFNHYSALLFAKGINPYGADMSPSYGLFNVPGVFVTPTTTGGTIVAQSYPALSFLFYVPLVAAGLKNMLWANLGLHLLGIAMVAAFVPRSFRPLAPFLFFLDPSYFDFALGSVTDVTWLPFGIALAFFWSRNNWASAVLLGLAAATKQPAWFIAPFALIHWYATEKDKKQTAFLAVLSFTVFLMPNLPFLIWNWHAWVGGVLAPVSGGAIPYGSGLVQIASIPHFEESTRLFSYSWLIALMILSALYAKSPRALHFLPFIAPPIALFFSPRSLQNYFLYWPVLLVVYLLTVNRNTGTSTVRKHRFRSLALLALPMFMLIVSIPAIGLGFEMRGAELGINVKGVNIDSTAALVRGIDVEINNRSIHSKIVHLAVASSLRQYLFLENPKTSSGLFKIEGGTVTREKVYFKNAEAVPASEVLQVVAFGSDDDSVSYSDVSAFSSPDNLLLNGQFTAWDDLNPGVPVGWSGDRKEVEENKIQSTSMQGRRSLELTSGSPARFGWAVTSVRQRISSRFHRFRVGLYPLAILRTYPGP